MKLRLFLAVALICLCGHYIAALAQTSTNQGAKNAKSNSAGNRSGSTDEGEKRFQTNCGRCHNPPEDISPREARAVVRQMRVRAMLSAEDEKLILEFLAP